MKCHFLCLSLILLAMILGITIEDKWWKKTYYKIFVLKNNDLLCINENMNMVFKQYHMTA